MPGNGPSIFPVPRRYVINIPQAVICGIPVDVIPVNCIIKFSQYHPVSNFTNRYTSFAVWNILRWCQESNWYHQKYYWNQRSEYYRLDFLPAYVPTTFPISRYPAKSKSISSYLFLKHFRNTCLATAWISSDYYKCWHSLSLRYPDLIWQGTFFWYIKICNLLLFR